MADAAHFLTATEGNKGILPPEYARLIMDPLKATALPFNPNVATVATTTANEFRIPVLAKGAGAAWLAEGDEITKTKPEMKEHVVVPAKVAGLTVASREMVEDSNPDAMSVLGTSLANALVEQVELAFCRPQPSPAPAALPYAEARGSVAATADAALFHIRESIAAVKAAGARPSSILMNPADAFALSTVTESDTSRRTLLDQVETIDGLPLFQSAAVPAGRAWVLDASQVFTVLREDVQLSFSKDVYFTSDQIALRATLRVGFAFTRPERLGVVALDGGDPNEVPETEDEPAA